MTPITPRIGNRSCSFEHLSARRTISRNLNYFFEDRVAEFQARTAINLGETRPGGSSSTSARKPSVRMNGINISVHSACEDQFYGRPKFIVGRVLCSTAVYDQDPWFTPHSSLATTAEVEQLILAPGPRK